jgi:hypothetical protein
MQSGETSAKLLGGGGRWEERGKQKLVPIFLNIYENHTYEKFIIMIED